MNFSSNFDFDLKVIVLGHVSTGKSTFVSKLTQGIFISNPISTNNVQFYEKKMEILYENGIVEELDSNSKENLNNDIIIEEEEEDVGQISESGIDLHSSSSVLQNKDDSNAIQNKNEKKKYIIRLKIWDTAGAERYMSITKSYLRDSNIIFLFFDINNQESFLDLDKHWWQMLYDGGYVNSSVIILICNKCDLKQVVTDKDIQDFCNNHNGILNIKVSPKEDINVTESIYIALQEYFKTINTQSLETINSRKIELGVPLDEKNELVEDNQIPVQSGWGYWCKC